MRSTSILFTLPTFFQRRSLSYRSYPCRCSRCATYLLNQMYEEEEEEPPPPLLYRKVLAG